MRVRTLFAVLMCCLLVAIPFSSLASTPVTAEVSATGVGYGAGNWDWAISKSAVPASLVLSSGQFSDVVYTIDVGRTQSIVYTYEVVVTVSNPNDLATTDLAVNLVLQTSVDGAPYVEYVRVPVDVSGHPILGPYESFGYQIWVPFAPVVGASYKLVAEVVSTNMGAVSPEVLFELPADTVVYWSDLTSDVFDSMTCPEGFTCEVSRVWPAIVSQVGSIVYSVRVTNVSAPCDTYFYLTNTATLSEWDEGRQVQSSASVEIYTGECASVCTLSKGFWKTHAGEVGKNADRVTPLLPVSLGSLQVTSAGQAVSILSNMGSNGIDKLMAQLLATKLNLKNGANGSSIVTVVSAADAFLMTHTPADWESLSRRDRQMVLGWMSALDSFIDSNHCG